MTLLPLKYRIHANLLLLRALTSRADSVAGALADQLKAASDATPEIEPVGPTRPAVATPGFLIGALAFVGFLYVIRRRRRGVLA